MCYFLDDFCAEIVRVVLYPRVSTVGEAVPMLLEDEFVGEADVEEAVTEEREVCVVVDAGEDD